MHNVMFMHTGPAQHSRVIMHVQAMQHADRTYQAAMFATVRKDTLAMLGSAIMMPSTFGGAGLLPLGLAFPGPFATRFQV